MACITNLRHMAPTSPHPTKQSDINHTYTPFCLRLGRKTDTVSPILPATASNHLHQCSVIPRNFPCISTLN
jgi:hypothetical protein